MIVRNWTIHWNEREGQFLARYRVFPAPPGEVSSASWNTKRIPKKFEQHQELEAERWMVAWYAAYAASGGLPPASAEVVPAKKTLRVLGPRWLEYRYRDRGTKTNTYKGFKLTLEHWILDAKDFPHFSIESRDMDRGFTAEVCLHWIDSLTGAPASVLSYVSTLTTIFDDCAALSWLDADGSNPFRRRIIQKRLTHLRDARKANHVVVALSQEQVDALLTTPSTKIPDFRRVRYVLDLATGLRDHEEQGLIWRDMVLQAPVPYVLVDRQLDKIGSKPFRYAADLEREGLSKDAILKIPNAVVSPPKKNSRRAIPLLPTAITALEFWFERGWKSYVGRTPSMEDPVFPSSKVNRRSPPGQFAFVESAELLRKDLERVGQPLSQDSVKPDYHALRRTFATMLKRGGTNDADIGELLGHGAKSVARGHYIEPETLARKLRTLACIRLPQLPRV